MLTSVYTTTLVAGLIAVSQAHARSSPARANLASRQATNNQICSIWDSRSISNGRYTLFQNIWNRNAGYTGTQCIRLNSDANGIVSWDTDWQFTGLPLEVKSCTSPS